jgi:hypothetical protein
MTTPLSSFLRGSGSRPESTEKSARALDSGMDYDPAREAFTRISSSGLTTKSAVADDTLHETEDDARKRRLGELLRRRQHTGLDTGSATPNPPRDNS